MRPIVMTHQRTDPPGRPGSPPISRCSAPLAVRRVGGDGRTRAVRLYPLPTTVVGGELRFALREAAPAAVNLGVPARERWLAPSPPTRATGCATSSSIRSWTPNGSSPGRGRGDPAPVATRDGRDAERRGGGLRAGRLAVVSTSDMASAAAQLASLGTPHVVITGGGLGGDDVSTPSGRRPARALCGRGVSTRRTRAAPAACLGHDHRESGSGPRRDGGDHAREGTRHARTDGGGGGCPRRREPRSGRLAWPRPAPRRTSDRRPTPPDVRAVRDGK